MRTQKEKRETEARVKRYLPFYDKTFTFVCGHPVHTHLIPWSDSDDQDLGYTDASGDIYLAGYHNIMNELKVNLIPMFVEGVGMHECMHQVFTNFDVFADVCEKLPIEERPFFQEASNLLEDPAIEFFARGEIGGDALKALKLSIAYTYQKSPNIETIDDPYGQFVTALIQFGDMGVLKGRFTYPEAQKVFAAAIPVFAAGIEEPNNIRRIEIAKEVFEISRPLWQGHADAHRNLVNLLKQLGKEPMRGSGSGKCGNSDVPDDEKSENRTITAADVEQAIREASEGDAKDTAEDKGDKGNTGTQGEKDETCDTGETGAQGDKGDNGDKGNTGETGAQSDKGDNGDKGNTGETGAQSDKGDNGDKGNGDRENKPGSSDIDVARSDNASDRSTNSGNSSEQGKPSGAPKDMSKVHIDMSEEAAQRLIDEGEKLAKKLEHNDNDDVLDFEPSLLSSLSKTPIVQNVPAKDGKASVYQSIVAQMSASIAAVAKKIDKIFEADIDTKVYKSSGKLSLPRMQTKKQTSVNLFEKRRTPDGKKDLAVEILVDMSGSMHGQKIQAARECCIALAETFSRIKVPLYVIGFTADVSGADAYHYHFVQWKNTPAQRYRLCNIQAISDNSDGVTIRYGALNLAKRPEHRKLLIVISDGMPASNYYWSGGFVDTKKAVEFARHQGCDVLGVAVQMSEREKQSFKEFYGNDYIVVNNSSDLFPLLAKKLKALVDG